MNGSIDRYGHCQLSWDTDEERLYSPDGSQQLLPCDRCGQPQWVAPNAVSVLCDDCAKPDPEDLPEEAYAPDDFRDIGGIGVEPR